MTDTRTAQEMVERLRKERVFDCGGSLTLSLRMTLDEIGKSMGEAATLIASLSEEKERLLFENTRLAVDYDRAEVGWNASEARALAAEAALAKAVEGKTDGGV